jgi:hypothetical protein
MTILAAVAIGLGAGLLYFGALWLAVRRLVLGSPGRRSVVPGAAARLAALGLVLASLARAGAGSLLGGLAGLLIARMMLLGLLGGLRDG